MIIPLYFGVGYFMVLNEHQNYYPDIYISLQGTLKNITVLPWYMKQGTTMVRFVTSLFGVNDWFAQSIQNKNPRTVAFLKLISELGRIHAM